MHPFTLNQDLDDPHSMLHVCPIYCNEHVYFWR